MAENKGKDSKEVSDVARREEEILDFWNENDIFKKSEEKPAPKGDFVFYDGPPFATGLPHYGHILAGTVKDAIPRYRTMRGYRVRRKWGWDCHGLPLENEIEKELNLKTKRDIEALGVGEFNEAARKAVLRYANDWKKIVPRLGRFVDMDRDYKTMDTSYTESVWWVFKTLYDKNLIYTGFKSMHLCPRCGTTLSNFEVNLGYKNVEDLAVTVKLPIVGREDTALLVWTTTAWTLPGNMAAAVNKDAVYVKARVGNEKLILAKERLDALERPHEVLEEFPGEHLIGLRYVPPFDYFCKSKNIFRKDQNAENAWKIYHAPYVSLEEGTGIVHLAPAFGEEDMELAKQNGIPIVHHVDKEGRFIDQVKDFAGELVKPKEDLTVVDNKIADYLEHKELLFKRDRIAHSYPFCWRCDTPLLNYAAESWFVKVRSLRAKLVAENKRMRWVPQEVGKKRFGNWLESARDWAISRSRYWGAPLPVWSNETTGAHTVIGSLDELKKHTKRSGNHYVLMRHGEADSNRKGVVSSNLNDENHLTDRGREQVRSALQEMRGHNFDVVYISPLVRARETAAFVTDALKIPQEKVIIDERLREIKFGVLDGKSRDAYWSFYSSPEERFVKAPEGGETVMDVKRRVGEFLYEVERSLVGKHVLVIAHEDVLWMLTAVSLGMAKQGSLKIKSARDDFFRNGEVRELAFTPLPHNKDYELDMHRPYIDELELADRKGNRLVRTLDVFDCWFESGSMPYGQYHYPFENTDIFEPRSGWFRKSRGYPADFIAESIDQTRGWFYSLLVLGVALFGRAPYRNVITNGLVLAEDGRKMSKRLKNYPDPFELAGKYGADALRYYLLSSPVMRGEDLNFSEQGVAEVMRKIIVRLSNVHAFYELYADASPHGAHSGLRSDHVLDRWIRARLTETIHAVTDGMEHYELDRAARPLADFVDDLSTWYLRRSRDRFKGDDRADKHAALSTLRYVLLTYAKLAAPFMPFYAESLFRTIGGQDDPESVHLAAWPSGGRLTDEEVRLFEDMKRVRSLVASALEKRAAAGMKVRQPLRALAIKDKALSGRRELLELIRDEVNVKEIVFDAIIEHDVMLDTVLTEDLKEEGEVRALIRQVQELRKRANLSPHEKADLIVRAGKEAAQFIEKHKRLIQEGATLSRIRFGESGGEALWLKGEEMRASVNRV